ncbi:MAG TPA: VOC family protein [Actinomycetes bacterium]|nr:VOC family protein [Actinomycetes bacterium]
MGTVDSYPDGTFCWVDLATPGVPGARAFYTALLGWETVDLPAGDGAAATRCRLRGLDVAAIHRQAGDEPAGWGSSVSVDDVDATAARAQQLGASVLGAPSAVADAGRTALLADPGGARVSLWQAGTHAGARLVNEVGAWTWNELVTPDVDGAKEFYAGVFGWTAQDAPGPLVRAGFALGGLLVGGVHAPTAQEGATPRWTVAFRVADADAGAARVEQLGGRVLLPPLGIATGRFAIVADPAGASFTVTAGRTIRGLDGA